MRVRPGAHSERITVEDGLTLLVATRARAIEGQANEAVRRAVAAAVGVPARDVMVVHGERSRNKLLRIENLTPQEALARVERNTR